MLVNTVKMSGVVALAGLLLASPASAFNFGDMMNPSKWMGGDDDDEYYGPGPGYGPGPSYGPGPNYRQRPMPPRPPARPAPRPRGPAPAPAPAQ